MNAIKDSEVLNRKQVIESLVDGAGRFDGQLRRAVAGSGQLSVKR
jgi:hypothetical protein